LEGEEKIALLPRYLTAGILLIFAELAKMLDYLL